MGDLFEKLKGFVRNKLDSSGADEVREPVDLDVLHGRETSDKSLMSLRRLRRKQLDEVERERLSRQVSNFNRERDKRAFFGFSILGNGSKPVKKDVAFLGSSCGFMKKKGKGGGLL